MSKLVLIRHGQSLWNLENRFTGWVDVPLTSKGAEEARAAAERIKDISLDVAYTSALSRAQKTLEIILEANSWSLPVIRDQALNERDYGDLSGLNKAETAEKYGDEMVHTWRRSYDIAPPGGESLKDTRARTVPFFERCIMGDIRQGKNVLVVAHGNSNRSIVMAIEELTPDQIIKVELGTGIPYLYEVDAAGIAVSKTEL